MLELTANDSTVTFCGVNEAQIAGQLVDVPNVSQVGFWEAAVDETAVNGRSLTLRGARTAILDTGTSTRESFLGRALANTDRDSPDHHA